MRKQFYESEWRMPTCYAVLIAATIVTGHMLAIYG